MPQSELSADLSAELIAELTAELTTELTHTHFHFDMALAASPFIDDRTFAAIAGQPLSS